MTPIVKLRWQLRKKTNRYVPFFVSEREPDTADLYNKLEDFCVGKDDFSFSELSSKIKQWGLKAAKAQLIADFAWNIANYIRAHSNKSSAPIDDIFMRAQQLRSQEGLPSVKVFHSKFYALYDLRPWAFKDDVFRDVAEHALVPGFASKEEFRETMLQLNRKVFQSLLADAAEVRLDGQKFSATDAAEIIREMQARKQALLTVSILKGKRATNLMLKGSDLRAIFA